MSDQAALLRRMVGAREDATVVAPTAPEAEGAAPAPQLRRDLGPALRMASSGATVIAVTSGKGGVGKSNLSINLALALGASGDRVALVDVDLGLANADVLCGVQPLATLEQCLAHRRPLRECAVQVHDRFMLVPGASGVARLADLDPADRSWLLEQIGLVAASVDWLIVDTGAGIGTNTVAFAAAADRVFVVTTPEPPSMADAYGMVKTLASRVEAGTVELVVNQARDEDEARGVWLRLDRVSRAFLSRDLPLAGWIPFDASLPQAVRARIPLLVQSPRSAAAKGIVQLAHRLRSHDRSVRFPLPHARLGGESDRSTAQPPTRSGFLGRLSRFILGAPESMAGR